MNNTALASAIDIRDTVVIFRRPRWQPKTWHPVYEQVVALAAAGKTNLELAEIFDYTPQQVSNILCTEEAKKVLSNIADNLRTEGTKSVQARLERLTNAALDVSEDILITRKDEFLEAAPFKLLDRSLAILRGVGKMIGEDKGVTNNTVNNTMIISDSHQKQISSGLDKAVEAWKLHGFPEEKVMKAIEVTAIVEVADDNNKGT